MQELTKTNYFDSIKNGAVVVDVRADWCPDCRRIEPIIKDMQKEYSDKVQFFSVNFSKEEDLKDMLNIHRIPTLIFYKNGSEVGERLVEPDNRVPIEEGIKNIL